MKLRLERRTMTRESTIGQLFIDGAPECVTLEDVVRPNKIPGKTAIPAGQYPVELTWSPRFQRTVPAVENVPGFVGIRIHPGNTAGDTEGCILVGCSAGADTIFESRKAYYALFEKLQQASPQSIDIQILDPTGSATSPAGPLTPGTVIGDQILAAECFRQSTRFEVVGSYLAAVAKYRSDCRNDRAGLLIGPFRLTETEWEEFADLPELEDDFGADITNWRAQCALFALSAQHVLDELERATASRPSPIEIYLGQIIGTVAAAKALLQPTIPITELLQATRQEDLPGQRTMANILEQHGAVLTARGTAINATTALSRILTVLTPADTVMRPLVEAAGAAPSAPKSRPYKRDELFCLKAPGIMRDLMLDFSPLNSTQAAAILGNIGHECAGFKLMQEVRPRAGRGGYGWCQWTGTRRVAYEAWCRTQHLALDDDQACYGFLARELGSTHKSAIAALRQTRTIGEAVVAFEKRFEVAAADAKHYPERERYARVALQAFR